MTPTQQLFRDYHRAAARLERIEDRIVRSLVPRLTAAVAQGELDYAESLVNDTPPGSPIRQYLQSLLPDPEQAGE